MAAFPILHTDPLTLVEMGQQHTADLFELYRHEEVTRFYNLLPMQEEAEAQRIVEVHSKRWAEQTGIRWGIALVGSNTIFGTIGYSRYEAQHRATIGYSLHPAHWNKGYSTEALKAVVTYGFESLNINRIEAEVMPGNAASNRVLEKLGFSIEGLLRQWMHWNNQHYDMLMYALLAADWRSNSNKINNA